jgi:hypothetical protein
MRPKGKDKDTDKAGGRKVKTSGIKFREVEISNPPGLTTIIGKRMENPSKKHAQVFGIKDLLHALKINLVKPPF